MKDDHANIYALDYENKTPLDDIKDMQIKNKLIQAAQRQSIDNSFSNQLSQIRFFKIQSQYRPLTENNNRFMLNK